MVAGGVAAPGRSGLAGDSGGGVVVVAERLGDDGSWDLEDELAQRGGPAGQGGDAEIPDELAEVAGVQRLAGSASGEQPAGTGVGGGLQVVALGGGLYLRPDPRDITAVPSSSECGWRPAAR